MVQTALGKNVKVNAVVQNSVALVYKKTPGWKTWKQDWNVRKIIY